MHTTRQYSGKNFNFSIILLSALMAFLIFIISTLVKLSVLADVLIGMAFFVILFYLLKIRILML